MACVLVWPTKGEGRKDYREEKGREGEERGRERGRKD